MLKVGIYGASGYTGQELLRILIRHPSVEIVALTSRRFKGMPVSDIYPVFENLTGLKFMDSRPEDVSNLSDIVFSALPHGTAMDIVPAFFRAGKKVIDLSADFRLGDVDLYERHYTRHSSPNLLQEAVYGLPEIHRDAIKKARIVANPGCYPTSVILGLAPALKEDIVEHESIFVDSKSGVSGAGREPKVGSLFCEVNEGFKAYNVFKHRHTPEMEQELSKIAGADLKISFVPHLLPVSRGILSTIYATLKKDISASDLISVYKSFYRNEGFVRVYRESAYPSISSVRGSNFCDIGLAVDRKMKRVVIFCAIDNLIKGAAGQAVQNMNLMSGLPENSGLDMVAVFP